VFDARRVAGRILGQGDVVALVEKAAAELDASKAEQMAKKLAKGKFDLDDLSDQLGQMEKMGGMEGLMGLLPGVQKIKKQMAEANINDRAISRQRAIIGSMTKVERKKPDILQASRKRRIAAGAGVEVAEVNRLLKQHRQMQDAFKFMAKDGGKNLARMAGMMGGDMSRLKNLGGGRMPPPEEAAAPALPSMLTGGRPAAPPSGLPGLGGASKPTLPGLGGGSFNPFKKP
jgi:signal recognition particle subunit SRP54